jgi:two-component system, response regulator
MRLGMSQEELAGRAGLHRTYVCDVESGRRNLSLESIEKLARALETPVSKLLTSSGKSSSEKRTEELLSSDELVDILYVEDRADDVELAIEALQAAGITNRIHVVRDGAEALQFLFCTGQYVHRRPSNRPQLILLDLELPKIGGLEVLRRIKADPQTRDIPVIVLTASNRDKDIATSRRLGAEDYIVKPVDFQNLSEVTPKLNFQWALLKPMPALG